MHRALAAFILLLTGNAASHGAMVLLEEQNSEVAARALFEDGSPMINATVAVFSETDPVNPWLAGRTDSSGVFLFTPDTDHGNRWTVQVRLAGHGGMAFIELERCFKGSGGFTALQKMAMAGCVFWGFAGTAMYFRARRLRASS